MGVVKNPVLRFKNDKGEDYPDWESKRLGEVSKILPKSKLGLNQAKQLDSGNIPFISSGKSIIFINEYMVDGKTIFANDGGVADFKFYRGKASYSDHTIAFTSKNETITDSKFIFYILSNKKEEININLFRGAGLKNMSRKDFLNFSMLS